jgi:hypothetical protein
MRIFVGNHVGTKFRQLIAKYPDNLGNLLSPPRWMNAPGAWALDNGAYIAFKNGTSWDEKQFFKLLDKIDFHKNRPEWVLCPDVVGSKEGTLLLWEKYSPLLLNTGLKIAFAVQDGMTPADVPESASLVFVGGSTQWKWTHYHIFCRSFPTHVGRVNTYKRLWQCHHAGAQSIDGTGWFRKSTEFSSMSSPLYDYLAIVNGEQEKESDTLFPVFPFLQNNPAQLAPDLLITTEPPSPSLSEGRSLTLSPGESIFLTIARQGTKKGWLTPQYKIKYGLGHNSTTTNPHKVRQRTYGPYWVFCWQRPGRSDGHYYLGKMEGAKFRRFCETWKSSHSLEEILGRLKVQQEVVL